MTDKFKDDGDPDLFGKYVERERIDSLSKLLYIRDKEFENDYSDDDEGIKLFRDD